MAATLNDSIASANRAADASTSDTSASDGGARVPGETPAEVPADNRDPGNETPMPDGDTNPMPGGDTAPAPDVPMPTPAPTEVPQMGQRQGLTSGTDAPLSSGEVADDIASNTRGNDGLGSALGLEMGGGGTSSTEDAMARTAAARERAGK